MSSTRKAALGAPLSQVRYMSAPEYAENDGVKGMPVAAKAKLYNDEPEKKALLLFLQELSSREGGFEKLARRLIERYPDCLATPTMRKHRLRGANSCNADQVRRIRAELGLGVAEFPLRGEFDEAKAQPSASELEELGWKFQRVMALQEAIDTRTEEIRAEMLAASAANPNSYPASVFEVICRDRATQRLARFLWEFCLNPRVKLIEENPEGVCGADLSNDDVDHWDVFGSIAYFRNLTGTLLDYHRRHQDEARAAVAETEVGKQVSRTLTRGLASRKIVVIEGVEGIGKSFNGEAWVNCHLGEARFVRLEGIVTKTTFFQAVSGALGLADGARQKSQEMQARIRQYLERTGIMLVIDEAHRLFQQTERISSHPELLNWVYTMWDLKIPVALLVTPQFISRMDEVERQTDWRSGQFKRRVLLWTKLPQKIALADLLSITKRLAPGYTPNMVEELADYAGPLPDRQIDAISRAIEAARFIAAENGRKSPTGKDLVAGIKEAQQTGLAMITPGDLRKASGRGRRALVAQPMQDECMATEPGRIGTARETLSTTKSPTRGTRPELEESVVG